MQGRYADPEREQVSLIRYLTSPENGAKNIFLIGEGGNGKTVSLLRTADYLLGQNQCAFYIPVKSLRTDLDIDGFLYRYVFGRMDELKYNYEALLRGGDGRTPNVTFLLVLAKPIGKKIERLKIKYGI